MKNNNIRKQVPKKIKIKKLEKREGEEQEKGGGGVGGAGDTWKGENCNGQNKPV